MNKGYQRMREAVLNCPLSLEHMPKHLQHAANYLMDRDTGIEIEAYPFDHSAKSARIGCNELELVDGIKEANYDGRLVSNEFKFRLNTGIKGMLGLWNGLKVIKNHWGYNELSGIHYRVDFPEYELFEDTSSDMDTFCRENEKWLLNSLEWWNYTGDFNNRTFSRLRGWVRLCTKTEAIEYRIGTQENFNYTQIMKKILNCHKLTKLLAARVKTTYGKRELKMTMKDK